MGLYLCVFDSDSTDNDLDGIEIGTYEDFGRFRDEVHQRLEDGDDRGERFPILLQHSDCDGEWTVAECQALLGELATIRGEWASTRPPEYSGWQAEAAQHAGHTPASLADHFVDVDGEVLLDRLTDLAKFAVDRQRPITFQ